MRNSDVLIVFDLDGTLNATHLYSTKVQRKAIAEFHDKAFTDAELVACMGDTGFEYAGRLLPEGASDEDRWFYLKREAYWDEIIMPLYHGTFDGVVETLARLKADGYQTAVCSNAPLRYIDFCIGMLELEAYIDHRQPLLPGLSKVDTLRMLLERVGPQRAIMVGDRKFDLEAARGNGIPFVGCRYGYGGNEIDNADCFATSGLEVYDCVAKLLKGQWKGGTACSERTKEKP